MSEQTVKATEAVIDAQAEAAKAQVALEETQRTEAPVVEAVIEAVEHEEEQEQEVWEEHLNALKTEMQMIREELKNSHQQLASQLLTSMTEVFQTAVATIAVTQSNQPVSPITETPEPVEENPVVIEEPAVVVAPVEEPRARTRKI